MTDSPPITCVLSLLIAPNITNITYTKEEKSHLNKIFIVPNSRKFYPRGALYVQKYLGAIDYIKERNLGSFCLKPPNLKNDAAKVKKLTIWGHFSLYTLPLISEHFIKIESRSGVICVTCISVAAIPSLVFYKIKGLRVVR